METLIAERTINHQRRNAVNYASLQSAGKRMPLADRIQYFNQQVDSLEGNQKHLYFRRIESQIDRHVWVTGNDGVKRKMIMFGSNSYLGLANHPYVKEKVKEAIDKFGVGIGGPPLLNGYSKQMQLLEERLAALKGTEKAMIYTSGYNANIGLITGICNNCDVIIADEYSHASFFDGIKMLQVNCKTFKHNNLNDLERLLAEALHDCRGNLFVAVEGVYSMDGDLAPLNRIIPICKKFKAQLLIDDAHGTCVLGQKGGGTMEEFDIPVSDEIILGTFSKAFSVNGGFLAAPREVIDYLRFMSRPYMFSAALPPVTLAAVLAGLDVMEKEPWLRSSLRGNVEYLANKLKNYGLTAEPRAGIVALNAPINSDIRDLANQFQHAGIFLNAIEFPAVPIHKQRFRISIMASHTKSDLDKLVDAVEEIWTRNSL